MWGGRREALRPLARGRAGRGGAGQATWTLTKVSSFCAYAAAMQRGRAGFDHEQAHENCICISASDPATGRPANFQTQISDPAVSSERPSPDCGHDTQATVRPGISAIRECSTQTILPGLNSAWYSETPSATTASMLVA